MIDAMLGFAALVVFPGAVAVAMDVAHYYDPSDKLIRSFVYGLAVVIIMFAGI